MLRISADQARWFRLARHHLDRRAPREKLVEVVRELAGVQAQVLSAAYLSLWARVDGLSIAQLDAALYAERTLVKTWAMRATVHLLASRELPCYTLGLGDAWRVHAQWLARSSGIAPEAIDAVVDAIGRGLARGPSTRKELAEHVRRELGAELAAVITPGGGVMKHACGDGVACFGPPRGQEITFVRVDEWLPVDGWMALSKDEAEEELLRRYLRAFGPATVTDFAYWTGMPLRDARPIAGRIQGELVEVTLDGKRALLLAEDVEALERVQPSRSIRLLPNFDVYLLGHRDKSHLVDDAHYKAVYRNAGWISQTVQVDGRVAGIWTHRRSGRRLAVHVEPFEKLDQDVVASIHAEAEDLARFLGMSEADVRVGDDRA